MPCHLARGLDHFTDGISVSAPDVIDQAVAFTESIQGEQVCRYQVSDMDVIADAGAVRGRIVGTVDLRRFTLTQWDAQNEGDEMGFGLMSLPTTTCMRSFPVHGNGISHIQVGMRINKP